MGRPTPPHVARRTAGDVVRGISAAVALAGVLVGFPAALIALGANPIPSGLPTLDGVVDALTRPDDGTLFVGALTILAWIGWATFAAPILLEIPAQIRGVRAPRLPGFGVQQRTASALVTAVAVLVTTGAASTAIDTAQAAAVPVTSDPQSRQTELTQPAPPITADSVSDGTAGEQTARVSTPAELAKNTTDTSADQVELVDETHLVERGDTLWDIADDYYDDPTRWPEIYQASAGTAQPDGRRLTDPDLIFPGWSVTVPDVPTSAAPDTAPSRHDAPDVAEPDGEDSHTDGVHLPDDVELPQVKLPAEDTIGRGGISDPAPVGVGSPGAESDEPIARDDPSAARAELDEGDLDLAAVTRTATGIGVLLAGGIVALLVARRHMQHRRRRAGQRIPVPDPDVAALETELRATDGLSSADIIDRSLRTLAAAAVAARTALPRIRSARLTHHELALVLAEPAALPAPFEGTVDGRIWVVPADSAALLTAEEASNYPSPYPGLVSIGHDEEDALLLLDLEYLGLLGIRGDDETAVEVLTAIAGEYATSAWADDLQVTLVGDPTHVGLDSTLRTGRIRRVHTLDELLPELQQRAKDDRAAFAAAEVDHAADARVTGQVPDMWPPEIVLIAASTTSAERHRLAEIVDQLPRVAIAAVTTDPDPAAEWTIALTATEGDEPAGVLEPLGLTIRPQRVTLNEWTKITDLLSTADQDPIGEPRPELDLDDITVQTIDHAASAVEEALTVSGFDFTNAASEHVDPDRTAEDPTPRQQAGAPAGSSELRRLLHLSPSSSASDAPAGAGDEVPSAAGRQAGPGATTPSETPTQQLDTVGDDQVVTPIRTGPGEDAPYIRLLGDVDIIGNRLGEPEARKRGQLTRIAAYIALHPGTSMAALDAAIWPGHREVKNTRNTAISKLRRWFGKSTAGEPWLPRFTQDTGLAFHPAVRTDWDDWTHLLPDGPDGAPTENIRQAIELVRGRPFTGRDRLSYDWADSHAQDMICAIVDACHELATRSLAGGDAHAALRAIARGQNLEPGSELLWRDRFKAESLIGDRDMLEASTNQYRQITDDLGGEPEEDTVDLIDQLLTTAGHRAAI